MRYPWRVPRIAVLALVLLLAACNGTALFSSLSERQANQVLAALLERGIDADKQRAEGGDLWGVYVPSERVPDAVAILQARGLPSQPSKSLGEVFQKEGFVSSALEQRARYLFALSEELSKTFSQIDGVVTARVHLALPDDNVLSEEQPSGSASVVIIQRPEFNLERRETDIKAIVTDGVEGIDNVNRVTVKFFTRHAAELEQPLAAAAMPDFQLRSAGVALLLVLLGMSGLGLWFWRKQWAPAGRARGATEARKK